MVDAVNRRWISDSRVDRVPGDEFCPPRVVPSAAWPRELGRAPECRALGHRRVEDLRLAYGAGGRVAHALGSTAGEGGVLIHCIVLDSQISRRSARASRRRGRYIKGSVVPGNRGRRLKGLADELEVFQVCSDDPAGRERARDPVCGMEMAPTEIAARFMVAGREVVFCCEKCRRAYLEALRTRATRLDQIDFAAEHL